MSLLDTNNKHIYQHALYGLKKSELLRSTTPEFLGILQAIEERYLKYRISWTFEKSWDPKRVYEVTLYWYPEDPVYNEILSWNRARTLEKALASALWEAVLILKEKTSHGL